MRRIAWIVPASLAGLALAMAFALIVARDRKPSRALQIAAPGILRAGSGAPPEIAALNEQLAQLGALRKGATYGTGLEKVVRNPVPSLRATLGEQWRELGTPIGHVFVRPRGNRT